MSVLVLADISQGKLKKSTHEAVYYASKIGETVVLAMGPADQAELESLGNYGASKVLHASDEKLGSFYSKAYAKAIVDAAEAEGADTVVVMHNSTGKAVAGRVAVRMNAGLVSGVISVPDTTSGFVVEKAVFSGKAFAKMNVSSAKRVISLNPNSLQPEAGSNTAAVTAWSPSLADTDYDVEVVSRDQQAGGMVPLPEAELVVSAGRGMKGPENWGIIEELATELGATTACSRPVADTGWRPHHEHVGQTGVAIKPNLYIAIGISGAIQHLAGVNQSKTIVVINKDSEAPFFKAADYGVVGDAFEVVPMLTEAIRKYKAG